MNEDLKEFANILFAPTERDIYKERINKAIEYIEYYLKDIDNLDDVMINSIIFKELLNILKGDDKNV